MRADVRIGVMEGNAPFAKKTLGRRIAVMGTMLGLPDKDIPQAMTEIHSFLSFLGEGKKEKTDVKSGGISDLVMRALEKNDDRLIFWNRLKGIVGNGLRRNKSDEEIRRRVIDTCEREISLDPLKEEMLKKKTEILLNEVIEDYEKNEKIRFMRKIKKIDRYLDIFYSSKPYEEFKNFYSNRVEMDAEFEINQIFEPKEITETTMSELRTVRCFTEQLACALKMHVDKIRVELEEGDYIRMITEGVKSDDPEIREISKKVCPKVKHFYDFDQFLYVFIRKLS